MSAWLDPVREALDASHAPVPFFFRDDDAGWEDSRLFTLLDIFQAREAPVDLAVIPAALRPGLARRLSARFLDSGGRVRLHQHGFAHTNHEATGRKCEFGPSRTADEQAADLDAGHRRLTEALGPAVDPIFTPPWNRCTQTTADLLGALPYKVLSRDRTAAALRISGLAEIRVGVDWCRREKSDGGLDRVGHEIAAGIGACDPVGILLHHAVMPQDARDAVAALLDLLARHGQARCVSMMSLLASDGR